jgi:hypothetical protein
MVAMVTRPYPQVLEAIGVVDEGNDGRVSERYDLFEYRLLRKELAVLLPFPQRRVVLQNACVGRQTRAMNNAIAPGRNSLLSGHHNDIIKGQLEPSTQLSAITQMAIL